MGARPGVHGGDDLLDVDALEIDAGGAEAGVAELALEDVQRHSLACELNGMREYVELELDALRILRGDRAVADAATSALGELATRSDGYHRVPPTDALIAAAATEHGGLAVLHRDAHFDRPPRCSPSSALPFRDLRTHARSA
jgi:predicted nucleic acid-binding protein